jgi:hypothetical protein
MKNILLKCLSILFLIINFIHAGEITVTLVGTDPLTINIKADNQKVEAGNISIYLYFRDDGITDLDIKNVDVSQITNTFGWATPFETKGIETGVYKVSGFTFTRRLFYDNADISGNDFWTTDGINVIVCDFTTMGNGHVFVEINGPDGLTDWSGTPDKVSFANQEIALPVELSSLNALVENNFISIEWVTANEIDYPGFEIYRALEKEADYVLLSGYETNPDLTRKGDSSDAQEYGYIDKSVEAGITYWYKLANVDFNGNKAFQTSISATLPLLPDKFQLYQNYPNPFNPTTTIRFDIPSTGAKVVDTKLIIYNSLGQLIKNLYNENLSAGSYEIQWNGTTDVGNRAASGIYFAVFRADGFTQTKKLVLLK